MHRSSIVVLSLVFCLSAGANEEPPLALAQKAAAAYGEARYAEAAKLYETLVQRIPWSPGARLQAGRSLARSGEGARALEHLAMLVEFGVRFDPADAAWGALRDNARFQRLASRMRARTAPLIRSSVAFRLEKDLIPENIAFDPASGAFFVGSLYKAKIVRIAADGTVSDLVGPRQHGPLGFAGMKVDAGRRELWAAAGNFGDTPPLQVEDPESVGTGAIYRMNVDTGELIARYPSPGGSPDDPLIFNDLVLTPTGDIYTTAGQHGVWRIRRGADRIEPFIGRPGSHLNGIALTPDGKTLFAASHLEGILRIDIEKGAVTRLELPAGVALGGIDGLYVHDQSLVGIQNGTDPMRVVRAWLDPSMSRVVRFAVLEQEHPESDFPLTGTIVGDEMYYVARSQLRAFEGNEIWPDETLKETIILRLPLELTISPAP